MRNPIPVMPNSGRQSPHPDFDHWQACCKVVLLCVFTACSCDLKAIPSWAAKKAVSEAPLCDFLRCFLQISCKIDFFLWPKSVKMPISSVAQWLARWLLHPHNTGSKPSGVSRCFSPLFPWFRASRPCISFIFVKMCLIKSCQLFFHLISVSRAADISTLPENGLCDPPINFTS